MHSAPPFLPAGADPGVYVDWSTQVTPVLDERGITKDFIVEGEFPKYGNDDDRVDSIAEWVSATFYSKLAKQHTYRWDLGLANWVCVFTSSFQWCCAHVMLVLRSIMPLRDFVSKSRLPY